MEDLGEGNTRWGVIRGLLNELRKELFLTKFHILRGMLYPFIALDFGLFCLISGLIIYLTKMSNHFIAGQEVNPLLGDVFYKLNMTEILESETPLDDASATVGVFKLAIFGTLVLAILHIIACCVLKDCVTKVYGKDQISIASFFGTSWFGLSVPFLLLSISSSIMFSWYFLILAGLRLLGMVIVHFYVKELNNIFKKYQEQEEDKSTALSTV